MSASEAALLALAESVADGSAVDWADAETNSAPDNRAVVQQLRVIAELATLHRTMPADPSALPHASAARRAAASPAVGRWAHLDLIARLGGGSSGEVYRAFDRHLEREVALKLLRSDVSDSEDDFRSSRVVAEGRRLARLHHPNVVVVHGVAMHEGRVGLWMELVDGATLEELLTAHGPMSAQEAAIVGVDLCRALAALHKAGLIHRDVKTQNVVREAGGRIVLMDLGTGRRADGDPPGTSDLAGTPLYLAPELFEGGEASPGTDLYSLGVLLYRLVTASFPVRATSVDELRAAHAARRAVRLRDARPDLPTAFVQVVERAIAPDPADRYASAGELEADLATALHRDAPAAAGTSGPRVPVGWTVLGLLVAALLVALVASPGLPRSWFSRGAFDPRSIRSIAVLPLANLSGDARQEYLAEGLTEALIDSLARVHGLRVISRTSVMQFKGTTKPVRELAAALNVDAILEGSVIKSGDRVRISTDLVHAATDRHVWVDHFDRDLSDVLTLQADVARSVAREVQIQLSSQEQAGFAPVQSANARVQDLYLQGRHFWNQGSAEGYRQALDRFREAAALDPSFARAYAGEADVYNLLPNGMSPFTAYPLAKEAAQRALAIDPTLADAHTSIAFATFVFDRDWPAAESSFTRALALNPNYATAHMWYGDFLVAMGRFADAERHYDLAQQLDPLSARLQSTRGDALYYQRRYDDAIARFTASLRTGDGDPAAYINLTSAYALTKRFAEADGALLAWRNRRGASPSQRALAAFVSALKGEREAAQKADDLAASGSDIDVSANLAAYAYIYLGNRDRAFELLDRAERARAPGLLWAAVDPIFDPLRSDPRFAELLRRMRLAR